jgi:hypothetical protein
MPPKAFLDAFIWFYLFMGVLLLTGLVLNVLSACSCCRKGIGFSQSSSGA